MGRGRLESFSTTFTRTHSRSECLRAGAPTQASRSTRATARSAPPARQGTKPAGTAGPAGPGPNSRGRRSPLADGEEARLAEGEGALDVVEETLGHVLGEHHDLHEAQVRAGLGSRAAGRRRGGAQQGRGQRRAEGKEARETRREEGSERGTVMPGKREGEGGMGGEAHGRLRLAAVSLELLVETLEPHLHRNADRLRLGGREGEGRRGRDWEGAREGSSAISAVAPTL